MQLVIRQFYFMCIPLGYTLFTRVHSCYWSRAY